jgi:hypothetical protein
MADVGCRQVKCAISCGPNPSVGGIDPRARPDRARVCFDTTLRDGEHSACASA